MAIGGSGGSSGAIRAGRAFVELFAEDSKLRRALERGKAHVLGFASFISKIGAGMIGGGAAVLAPLAGIFLATTEHLDNLGESADRLGTTPEIFDALSKSAKSAGVDAGTLESSLSRMQALLSDAAAGGKETSAALASIGLDAKKLIDLSLDDQLAAIADGLASVGNAADRTAAARKIFGKGGAALLPLLQGGGSGLRSTMDQFRDPALNEAAKNAGRLNDALDLVKMTVKSTVASVVFGFFDMIGPIETVASAIVQGAKDVRAFIRENKALVLGIAAGAAALIAAGAAFVAFGATLAVLATAAGGIITAFVAVKAAIVGAVTFLMSPIGIILVAVAALSAGLLYLWSTTADGKGAIAQLKSGLGELVATFSSAFQGISDAFAAGDLALAGKIAFTALQLEFTKMLSFMTDRWNAFKGFFVDGWHDGIKLLKLAWTDFDEWIGTILLDTMKTLNERFTETFRSLLRFLASVARAIGDTDFANSLDNVADKGKAGLDQAIEDAKTLEKRKAEAVRKRIEDEAAAAQEERDKARGQDKSDLDEKIKRLQRELDALNTAAAEEAFQQALFDATKQDIAKGVAEASRMAAVGKGGFGGPLAAQFAIGDDVAEKTLNETKRAADGIEELPDRLVNVFGLRG